MTCTVCGAEATFWLCSNACALAHAKKRAGVDCALCSFDPRTGRIGRHNTRNVCPDCRNRPENRGWVVARSEIPDRHIEQRNDANDRLRQQQERPLPKTTARNTRIARLVMDGALAPVEYRDRDGRLRGKRQRWRALTVTEIAQRAGCDKKTVSRFIQHIEG
jgi:hypothetical protein